MILNENNNILALFERKQCLNVCAPMVRYSKLQFRQLVKLYDCDLTFTPMLLADSFVLSNKARANEFTTCKSDTPLVVQFAANNVTDFVGASTLVSRYCDGVDLNCGCPQRWAKKLGLGCELMNSPETICSMIKECKSVISKPNFTISVKLRILYDLRKTIDLCQKLDKAGVSFLTIHGRTPDLSTGPVNTEAIKLICENVSCPIIANGGVETLKDYEYLLNSTHCNGVMTANGLLTNPTLFSGQLFDLEAAQIAVEQWIQLCFINILRVMHSTQNMANVLELTKSDSVTFQCFHHHLVFMLSKILKRRQKQVFNNLKGFQDVLQFLCDHGLLKNAPFIELDDALIGEDNVELSLVYNTDNKYVQSRNAILKSEKVDGEEKDVTNGKYFNEFTLNELFV